MRYFDTPALEASALGLAGWAQKLTVKPAIAVGGISMAAGTYDTRGGGGATSKLARLIERFEAGEFTLIGVVRGHLADPHRGTTARVGGPFIALEHGHLAELL